MMSCTTLGDSIPDLIQELCQLHITDKRRAFLIQPQISRSKIKWQLKRKAYDTIFGYLDGPVKNHQELVLGVDSKDKDERVQILAYILGLRYSGLYDEANRLELLLTKLVPVLNKGDNSGDSDIKVSDIRSVLHFLISLADSVPKPKKNFLGYEKPLPRRFDKEKDLVLPDGPEMYGDTRVYRPGHRFYMHYPREVLEAEPLDLGDINQEVFHMEPGQGLSGQGLFNVTGYLNDSYEKNLKGSLFGGLVYSTFFSFGDELALPEIDDEDSGLFEIRIPTASTSRNESVIESDDHQGIQITELSSGKSDITFSDSALGSSIWDDALDFVRSKHHTWETRGKQPGLTDRPYMTELGNKGMDEWYNMQLKKLSLLCPSLIGQPHRMVSQNDLVKDVINVLLGIPSRTFVLIPEQQTFELTEGTFISGRTPETIRQVLQDFIECGTYYNRLTWFSRTPIIDSFYRKGLVFQAFVGAVRKVLQYYRAAILSIPQDITLLKLINVCDKIFTQMRFLALICKCDQVQDLEEDDKFPLGIELLSYIYRETLECSSTDHYPMMLSILQTSCGPYTLFVQDWVYHGICRDIYGEFMIEINEDYLHFRDENYWTNSYTLKVPEVSQSVPLFLTDLASQIFVCGKSINLLKSCCPQHFMCMLSEHDVPRISIKFSKEELSGIDSQCQYFVSKMQQVARQLTLSRKEKQQQEERAKQDLLQKAKLVAVQRLQRFQDKILDVKRREDEKKRTQFQFLKEQMETDQERRAKVKKDEKQEDKEYMAKVTRQEEALDEEEIQLEARAREELIEYYSKLSEEAVFREQKALWRVRRAQLDQARTDFLRYEEQVWQEEMNKAPVVQLDRDYGDLPSWAKQEIKDEPITVSGTEGIVLPAWAERGLQAGETVNVGPDTELPKRGTWNPERVLPLSQNTPSKERSPRTLPSPPSQPAGRPSTPVTRNRPPTPTRKTGVKLSDNYFASAESEESPVKSTVHVFQNVHATTESKPGEEQVKPHIKMIPDHSILKETQGNEDPKKTSVKLVENMSATKETEAEEQYRPHLKPSTEMSSTTQSTTERETAFPRMKKMNNIHSTTQTEAEEWKIKKASVFGHVSQQSTSETAGFIPKLKSLPEIYASLESDYKDFSIRPRIKMSKTMSATTESKTQDDPIRSGLRMSKVMTASTQSEYIDRDNIRLEKFKQRNMYGHSSNSSIQKLLYGDKSKQPASEEESKMKEESGPVWIDNPALEAFRYNDKFDFLNDAPKVDLLSTHYAVYGSFGDYEIGLSDDVDLYKYMPLPEIFKQSITTPLLAQISLVNDNVVNYFMVDLGIMEHFKALRRYMFMADGDFAQILSDILLEKLASNPKSHEMLNCVFLNGALNKAVKSSMYADDPYADNLSFQLKYIPKVLQQNAHDTLDCLELRYKVTWPLNIVITDALISKYVKVFSFMLQLKRTVWVLKDVWHRLKRDAAIHKAGAAKQFTLLQLYRQEMHHFVKVMQGYIANQVIHVAWNEFTEALNNEVRSLDDIHKVHLDYVEKTIFRCLLIKKAGPVMKIIQDIFCLIIKFRSQLVGAEWYRDRQTGELNHANFNNMVDSFKVFHEFSNFLFKVVNKLALKGYQPHLQELVLRLNFNDYYKAH